MGNIHWYGAVETHIIACGVIKTTKKNPAVNTTKDPKKKQKNITQYRCTSFIGTFEIKIRV